MKPILEVKNIEKYYGNKGNVTKAINRISFDVEPGEYVGIMGASGSGKTTLLNCISTIDKVTSGRILVNGIEDRVRSIAERLLIGDILEKYPYQVSGGQKQRTACARAIVSNPSLILADEPTGALDSKSARMLLDSIETLNLELNATILMVTHDAFTASYCKRILFIKDGKIFNELIRGDDSRKQFFDKIIEVVTLLGGDSTNVF